ncbi:MAG: glycosyltransferase, partial [Desulfovibrio sp.]|nr:glycosyltransferase [Desulfovibrio sp.]
MSHTIAIIAPSSVPYQIGGAEKFWLGLHRALSRYSGSSVELIKLPCPEDTFPEVVRSYRTFSELNLDHFDMVISTKYPAWMVRHHNHVLYLQHTLRGLYDTYHFTGLPERLDIVPTGLHDLMGCLRKEQPSRDDLHTAFDLLERAFAVKSLPSSLFAHPGPLLRETVHFFDRVALHPAQITAYLAISGNVTRRKDYFPQGVSVKILHHPSDILEYANNGHEYFFTASRLNRTKRVHLIVEAMRHVSGNTPLLIAGTGPELPFLRDLAGDDPRIRFLGYVPDEELPGYYANALAVPYTPMDEDYGLITIEAMHSGKPVITTHDAGGPCEFVHDGKTGTVCDPTPESLGRALNRMAENPELAARLGRNAQQAVAHIVWPETVRELMTYIGHCGITRARHERRAILVLSTYPADGQGAGGQRRLYHMCLALARHWHVLLVCYDDQQRQWHAMNELAPHVQEWRLPHGAAREEAARLSALTAESIADVALMRTCASDVVLG